LDLAYNKRYLFFGETPLSYFIFV